MPKRSTPRIAGLLGMAISVATLALTIEADEACAQNQKVTRYEHIMLIIAENQSYQNIVLNAQSPYLNHLATTCGLATSFYGEVHPSEANYVVMIKGDAFGIHDENAWYC
jgi:phosphatidylinositol-3-phosphatase